MNIAIVGAGGHGRVVLDILRTSHQFHVVGFLDGNADLANNTIDGVEVLGDLSLIPSCPELGIQAVVIAIGDNVVRSSYADKFTEARVNLVNAIHPSASIAATAAVGKNVVIAAGVSLCTHVTVEDSAICNTGCIIEHESHIGPAVHICPGVRLAGHVNVERSAFVGIGATVIQGVTIGEAAIIGAGAVVLQDVPAYATVVGVPARVVRTTRVLSEPRERREAGAAAISTADLEPARSLISRPVRRAPMSPPVLVETSPG